MSVWHRICGYRKLKVTVLTLTESYNHVGLINRSTLAQLSIFNVGLTSFIEISSWHSSSSHDQFVWRFKKIMTIIIIIITVGQDLTAGVRCGAEAAWSPVRFPMVSLELFKDLILPAELWPWVQLSLYQKRLPDVSPGEGGGQREAVRRTNNLTTFMSRLSRNSGSFKLLES